MIRKEEYKFKLEKFAERIGIGYFKLYISLSLLYYVLNAFIFPLGIIFISQKGLLWSYFYNELIWISPGFVSNLLSLVFLKVIRNNSIDTFNRVSVHLENIEGSKNLLSYIFQTWHHIAATLCFVLFSIIFQIKFLILSPWPWWHPWYEASPILTLLMAILRIQGTAFFYFLTFMLGYFCLTSCFLLHNVGSTLKKEIDVNKIESFPSNYIGQLSLLLSISWIITLSPGLVRFIVAPITWWTIIQVFGFIISSIFLFLCPTISTHQTLVKMKINVLERIKKKIWDNYLRVTHSPSKLEEIQKALLQIQSLQLYEARIKNISTWPFDTIVLIKFISILSAPIVSIIVRIAVESFSIYWPIGA